MNARMMDEIQLEATAWLRTLQETFMAAWLGERMAFEQPLEGVEEVENGEDSYSEEG